MSDIEYRVLCEEDLVPVRAIVSNEFLPRDPICKYVAQNYPIDGNVWCDVVLPHVEAGLSVVAVDRETGKIVGYRLSGIDYKDGPVTMNFSKDDSKTRGLGLSYEFDKNLYKDLDLYAKYGVDKMVSFRGLCVVEEYKHRGIATKMVEKSLDLIRAKNFRLVTVVTTSRFSRRIIERLGFHALVEKLYEETTIDGQPVEMTDDLAYHRNYALFAKII